MKKGEIKDLLKNIDETSVDQKPVNQKTSREAQPTARTAGKKSAETPI